ncbi:HNH endonuclease [uncultured Sphingomonas sp.]|uniref:HNH endonuclease n=1 Tax=uncultured Sphingomonas sp. TaxID=158754 RepID=UPI0035CA9652
MFDAKPGSGYDDEAAERYHFPNRYGAVASSTVGDWVVFRRPRADGGNLAYFAVARVVRIDRDPLRPNHSYARLADYLKFDEPVPWTSEGRYAEGTLRGMPRPQVGVFLRGRSMRPLDAADFGAIVGKGLSDTADPANAVRYGFDPLDADMAVLRQEDPTDDARRVETALVSRIVRDASFRRVVCLAYGDRCAVTRLRIVNGGGRAEVQAAHVWPVAEGGPDLVTNGLALSATVHWLFDRHLISLTDDYRLLVAHNRVPVELRALFADRDERIHLPENRRDWPNLAYVSRHRDIFAGYA